MGYRYGLSDITFCSQPRWYSTRLSSIGEGCCGAASEGGGELNCPFIVIDMQPPTHHLISISWSHSSDAFQHRYHIYRSSHLVQLESDHNYLGQPRKESAILLIIFSPLIESSQRGKSHGISSSTDTYARTNLYSVGENMLQDGKQKRFSFLLAK